MQLDPLLAASAASASKCDSQELTGHIWAHMAYDLSSRTPRSAELLRSLLVSLAAVALLWSRSGESLLLVLKLRDLKI